MKYAEWNNYIKLPCEEASKAFFEDESNVRELVLSILDDCPKIERLTALYVLEHELTCAFGPDSVWHDYARQHLRG